MLRLIKKSVFAAVVFYVVNIPAQVEAQTYVPQNLFSNPVLQRAAENRNMLSTSISGLIRGQMMKNSVGGTKGGKTSTTAGTTVFKASSTNSLVKLLASQSGTADQQKEAEAFFSRCLDLYWETARKDNFPSNDLAYGFNYFVVNSYHVYHNVFENIGAYQHDLTKAPNYVYASREKAVYEQFFQLLNTTPQIKKLTDKEKQQFTEMLAIMTNFAYLMYEDALKKGDRQLMKQARIMAKNNLENLFQSSADNIQILDAGVRLSK